ncbi:ROK family transcriptional regulator [Deinococcus roseus]|uniref:Sugar kinase n=1 Tax=Deinococcus roseus TaxID=392414 RepID=A0ABQ2CWN9_9DEIO|nr:ROK family transcriptional regulator [Deinococcus roseus]GGJ21523.1 sugar kinase [Deinococcus roseus]
MTSLKGDQGTTRALNRRLILNEIRRQGPTSRARLAEQTGLSPAAITFVTTELLQEGLLIEKGERRPIPLDIHYSGHFVIGLKLMESRLEAVLTDLSTQILARTSLDLPDHQPETVARYAARAREELCQQSGVDAQKLLGVGMGLPGVIDAKSGICLLSGRFGWKDIPIARLISEHTQLPVWVDNDVNAFAVAERLFGSGKNTPNFVVVTVGRAIGSAIVMEGKLYRGRNGGAGEFGHTLSEYRGRKCECGRLGCLEAYASEHSLLRHFQEISPRHHNIQMEGLLKLIDRKNERILNVLEDAGSRLGRNLADMANLLNPDLIVLGGEGVRLGEAFFRPMRLAFRERAFDCVAEDLPIAIHDWGDDAWARGAAGLATEHFFDFEVQPSEGLENN